MFCSDCCNEKWPLFPLGYSGPELVCDKCFQTLNTKGLDAFTFKEPTETLGLRLSHDQRKPRFIEFDNNEERDKWSNAIRVCSRYASPPVNKNKVLAAAFADAHRYCWNYNGPWWRWWRIFGDECEMLTVLVAFIVRERCLERVIRSMGVPSFAARYAANMAKTAIDNAVSSSVTAGWSTILKGAEAAEEKLREELKPLLGPIGEQQQKLMDNLRASLGGAINGAIASVGKPLIEKVLPMVFQPMLNVHVQSYRVLKEVYEQVKTECSRYQCNNERDFHWRVSSGNNSWWKVYQICNQELDPMLDLLRALGSVPPFNYLYPYGIYYCIRDNTNSLLTDAMFTVEKDERVVAVLSQGGAATSTALSDIWPDIARKYLHDSRIVAKETMTAILWQLIGTPILKTVLEAPGVSDALNTVDGLIPDPIKPFLPIKDLFEELVKNILTDVITETVANNSESCMARLEAGFQAYCVNA